MPPLHAGALRSRVTLQSPTRVANGSGGWTSTWADVATVWARVRQIAGAGDTEAADQTTSRRRYEVTIRRRSAVSATLRIVRNAQLLEVRVVRDDDDQTDALVLECVEITPGSAT